MAEGGGSPNAQGGGGNKRGGRNRRRRNNKKRGNGNNNNPNNNNSNHCQSQSRSPSRDDSLAGNNTGRGNNQSRSPQRNKNKSRSPNRNGRSSSPMRPHQRHHNHQPQNPDMTVVINRSDLWDSAAHFQPDETYVQHHQHPQPNLRVKPFQFIPHIPSQKAPSIATARVPYNLESIKPPPQFAEGRFIDVIDTITPNPHDSAIVHDKYWCQRRRLFSRFDAGIELDAEGWFSVTPEVIADHVAQRVANMAKPIVQARNDGYGIVILDAFCGCGGNSIAFGKIDASLVSRVVCVDTDRSKLMKAAHNASLYGIPTNKLIFIECNSTFILKYCYKNGQFVLDQPATELPKYMPKPVQMTRHAGYRIGGLDLLPRRIDAVFMDPPWGGVDYEVFGKNGYDLKKNMKIRISPEEDEYEADGDGFGDDFFDTFSTPTTNTKMSQKARKANFNKQTEGDYIDGMEMLKVAAEATASRIVLYDLPRNTNKVSLGLSAYEAGYKGNIKLEEHYLNGRLKTVTAYMGADYSGLINEHNQKQQGNEGQQD